MMSTIEAPVLWECVVVYRKEIVFQNIQNNYYIVYNLPNLENALFWAKQGSILCYWYNYFWFSILMILSAVTVRENIDKKSLCINF